MQTIVRKGTQAVAINGNTAAGPFDARLYVNCGASLGDATLVAKKFKSLAGASRWAASTLEAR